jgi:hypothetical protein
MSTTTKLAFEPTQGVKRRAASHTPVRAWLMICCGALAACVGPTSTNDESPFTNDESPFDPESSRALKFQVPEDTAGPLPFTVPPTSDEHVAVTTQAIVNGEDITGFLNTGVATIWAISNSSQEWRQICTATMVTNQLALTAVHCFTDPNFTGTFVLIHDGEGGVVVDGQAGPDGLDVALVLVHAPMTIRGSTSGYTRTVADGGPNLPAFAMGTGLSVEGNGVPSSACNAGTQGCLADPRAMRISLHETIWNENRWDTGDQLGVQANNAGQHPTRGDSGGPLLLLTSLWFPDFAELPVMGVATRMVNENGVWNSFYVPIQNFRPWLCGFIGC